MRRGGVVPLFKIYWTDRVCRSLDIEAEDVESARKKWDDDEVDTGNAQTENEEYIIEPYFEEEVD